MEELPAITQLLDAGFNLELGARNTMAVMEISGGGTQPIRTDRTDDDDLSLGASASPTTTTSKWVSELSSIQNVDNTPEYSYPPPVVIKQIGNQIHFINK